MKTSQLPDCQLVAVVLFLGAWTPQLKAQDGNQQVAITAIQDLGGVLQRDQKSPARPVIGISFRGTKVTDEQLKLLNQFPDLEILNLTQTAITDAGLKQVEGLSKLKVLYLSVRTTDAGLVHVKGLTTLTDLSLIDSQVTDAGLVHLEKLEDLKTLLLNGTKVTADGVRKVQQALPRTRIGH